jgi:hypothetical protein
MSGLHDLTLQTSLTLPLNGGHCNTPAPANGTPEIKTSHAKRTLKSLTRPLVWGWRPACGTHIAPAMNTGIVFRQVGLQPVDIGDGRVWYANGVHHFNGNAKVFLVEHRCPYAGAGRAT